MDWTTAQRARGDCFHDGSWAEYFTQPKKNRGCGSLDQPNMSADANPVTLASWSLDFSGVSTPQMLASLEMLDMVKMYTVTLMMRTNDVSRGSRER